MDGFLLSALVALFVLYIIVWMRGDSEMFEGDAAAVTDYKQKVMMIFAKYGKGQPIDISKLDEDTLGNIFKDFLIVFNEYQAKVNGKAVSMADVQKTFPIDFLNEYNATISK